MDKQFFCHDVRCLGFNGFEVPWIPGDEYAPGEWATDTCPHCGDYLHETYIDTDELKSAIEKVFAEEVEPLTNIELDVDVVRITELVLNEIRRQVSVGYVAKLSGEVDDWFTSETTLLSGSYAVDVVGDEHE